MYALDWPLSREEKKKHLVRIILAEQSMREDPSPLPERRRQSTGCRLAPTRSLSPYRYPLPENPRQAAGCRLVPAGPWSPSGNGDGDGVWAESSDSLEDNVVRRLDDSSREDGLFQEISRITEENSCPLLYEAVTSTTSGSPSSEGKAPPSMSFGPRIVDTPDRGDRFTVALGAEAERLVGVASGVVEAIKAEEPLAARAERLRQVVEHAAAVLRELEGAQESESGIGRTGEPSSSRGRATSEDPRFGESAWARRPLWPADALSAAVVSTPPRARPLASPRAAIDEDAADGASIHSSADGRPAIGRKRSAAITAASAAGGAVAMGTVGGATGFLAGGAIGAAVGIVPGLFTFGLAVPVSAAIGSGIGTISGVTMTGTVGAVGGGAAGYRLSQRIFGGDGSE